MMPCLNASRKHVCGEVHEALCASSRKALTVFQQSSKAISNRWMAESRTIASFGSVSASSSRPSTASKSPRNESNLVIRTIPSERVHAPPYGTSPERERSQLCRKNRVSAPLRDPPLSSRGPRRSAACQTTGNSTTNVEPSPGPSLSRRMVPKNLTPGYTGNNVGSLLHPSTLDSLYSTFNEGSLGWELRPQ